ncbi:YjbQ family protein [Nanoarchaeota archaeon NZ13-N]|nr:MAG: YjbQ family protein [Nanoarchaeota archaeon NZ13-N]
MKIYTKEISIQTNKRREVVNITDYVEKIVRESKIREGIALVFLPHATAGLFSNEDEPNIKKDYLNLFERLVPEKEDYYHNQIDNNADSHLLSSLFKQFFIYPVKDGKLIRGTWQDLFLAEFDGPRVRRVLIIIIGKG